MVAWELCSRPRRCAALGSLLRWLLGVVLLGSVSAFAQTNVNFTSSTLVVSLKWRGLAPWSTFDPAGSVQLIADGVVNATLSADVTTLTRLTPTNTVLHLRYGGSRGGVGPDLIPAQPLTLLPGKTNQVEFDLGTGLGFVFGDVTLNGAVPPPFRLVMLSDLEGVPWVGAQTDSTGRFRALVPSGKGTGQVYLVAGQGSFPFEIRAGEFNQVATIALRSAGVRFDLLYAGTPLAGRGIGGSIALNVPDSFGRLISCSDGSVVLGDLPATPLLVHIGYGAQAFEAGAVDLLPPLSLTLVAGVTNAVPIELGGVLGLIRGRALVNGVPSAAGNEVSIFAKDGRTLASARTQGDGTFQLLVPPGSGRGHVSVVDGQGDFNYVASAGKTTDLGDLRLGSGAVQINLSYNGRPISELNAQTAILVRAPGIFTNLLSTDSKVISNLPPSSGTIRIGFGNAILATESDFLTSTLPIPIQIVPGTTNVVSLDLCGSLGVIQGRVLLNGVPPPSGTAASLYDYAGRGYVTALTDSKGTFRALVPSGPGKGHVILVAGQGDFSFRVAPCSATEIGGVGQNQIPKLDPVPAKSVVAGTPIEFRVTGSDPDSSVPLVYSLEPGAPAGAILDPVTGVFRWTPSLGDGGIERKVLITGTDSGDPPSSDTIAVSIQVIPHRIPQVAIVSPVNGVRLDPGSVVEIDADASASDGAAIRSVDFYQGTVLVGHSLSAPFKSRLLNPELGSFEFVAVALDTFGASSTSAPVRISVALPPNHPPAWQQPAAVSQVEGREVRFTAHATDSDANQTIAYSLGSGAPAGARLNSLTGEFLWTPTLGQGARTVTFPVIATDSGTPPLSASVTVSILVQAHLPPTVRVTAPTAGATASALASIELAASAEGGTDPVGSVEFLHDGIRIGTVNAPPYRLTWPSVPAGTYQISARAIDLAGVAATSSSVQVTVTSNRPPATVRLRQPVDGASVFAASPIGFAVDLSNFDSPPDRVEYLSSGSVVVSISSAPFSADWIAMDPGTYSFTARAVLASGATVVSPAATVTVGGRRADVALVSSKVGPETIFIRDALQTSGRSVDLLSSQTLGVDALFGYRLAIWTDEGDPGTTVSESIVQAFENAFAHGTPIYFIGEHLLGAVDGVDSAIRARWYRLLRAKPSGLAAASGGALEVKQVTADHPILRARNGLVENFSYSGSLESADSLPGDVEVTAQFRGRPVLLMSPSADSAEDPGSPNTVTQFFLRTRGSNPTSAASRDALFGNAVDWLLGHLCFSQMVRAETGFTPEVGNVGEVFTLTLTVSARGECGATGVEIVQSIPSGWTVLEAIPSRGTVAKANGAVGFTLGRLPLLLPETLTLRILPTRGGTFTTETQTHWNEEPSGNSITGESSFFVSGTAAPSIALERSAAGHLVLHTSSSPGITLQLESSQDLVRWSPLQTIPGGERSTDLGQPSGGSQPTFFRTRVVP